MNAYAFSSKTEIEKQKISLYPGFSDKRGNEFSNFAPKPHKRPFLHIVGKELREERRDSFTTTNSLSYLSASESDENTTKIEEKNPVNDQRPAYSEIVNRDRIELLAKKYAQKKFSKEDDARLAIVTQKIRQLIPRVTIEDFEVLADIAEEIKRINEVDEILRNDLEF
jgi:hypothetical protein